MRSGRRGMTRMLRHTVSLMCGGVMAAIILFPGISSGITVFLDNFDAASYSGNWSVSTFGGGVVSESASCGSSSSTGCLDFGFRGGNYISSYCSARTISSFDITCKTNMAVDLIPAGGASTTIKISKDSANFLRVTFDAPNVYAENMEQGVSYSRTIDSSSQYVQKKTTVEIYYDYGSFTFKIGGVAKLITSNRQMTGPVSMELSGSAPHFLCILTNPPTPCRFDVYFDRVQVDYNCPTSGTAKITGLVTDAATGQPVAQASVAVYEGAVARTAVITSPGGYYITAVPAVYGLNATVSADGYISETFGIVGDLGPFSTAVQPTVALKRPCVSYAIAPSSASYASSGGGGSIAVAASPEACAGNWSVISNASWITAGSSGDMVSYTVASNTGTASRTGTITVAGQTFTVTQAPPCAYSIAPASASYEYAGGSGSISVSASPAGCTAGAWIATSSDSSWLAVVSGGSGSGSGTVGYSVAAHSGTSPRNGTITVAGKTFTVAQSGHCSYDINPVSKTFTTGGGTDSVIVTSTTAGCTGGWTAESKASWIRILSGASGSGSGTVSYAVDENTGSNTRTGTMAIAGKVLAITQEGIHLMAVPAGTHVVEHPPVFSPVLDIDPQLARPFGSGNIGAGTVDLGVGFAGFEGPVDIYLGLGLPDEVSTEVWIIFPDLSVQPASQAVAPWRTGVTAAVDEPLYDVFPISMLPPGRYSLYTLVSPAGRLDAYYFWVTGFTTP